MINCKECKKQIKNNKNKICFECFLKSPLHPNNRIHRAKSEIRKCKTCKIEIGWGNKYDYCRNCYNVSPEIKVVCEQIVNNRPDYSGENNPHYRGGLIKLTCPCGVNFEVYPARKDTARYCSTKCKKKYSISKAKYFEYKDLKLRSSWELTFAKYLDGKGLSWKYEPESFETSHGFYTPDFWVEELNSYVEVKGYFRDENSKQKFEEFSKSHNIILADLNYFKSIGYVRITSGPQKGQLCLQAAQS